MNTQSELGSIADPSQFAGPLDTTGHDVGQMRGLLSQMLTIRIAEEALGDLVTNGEAGAPCHLGIGQEAVAVGVAAHLRSSDRVFGGHRSHSQFLALGGSTYDLIAEVLGKADGASRGMGGSMHLFGRAFGFLGSVPLVAATIPIATGAGLAAQFDGRGDIAVPFFGDGATEEGVFHESMNLASILRLPVVFVCENNLFSSHLDINIRQPSNRIARYGEAHCMPSETVDGNDVLAVSSIAARLIARARAGEGPALLEAVTYRHRGHVGPNDDIDVGIRRSMEEVKAWKKRDPIDRLRRGMTIAGNLTDREYAGLVSDIRERIIADTERARRAAFPPSSALLDCVYSSAPEKGR
jgi:TPP-dependent pyruvate/acetoin dehydrogenase alpha subunit